ncbi:MAG: hypothetical protein QG665_250 [Patescibacteria group bacterium]|nr:hypothetical protein [Patescibacteria group bacterium]
MQSPRHVPCLFDGIYPLPAHTHLHHIIGQHHHRYPIGGENDIAIINDNCNSRVRKKIPDPRLAFNPSREIWWGYTTAENSHSWWLA